MLRVLLSPRCYPDKSDSTSQQGKPIVFIHRNEFSNQAMDKQRGTFSVTMLTTSQGSFSGCCQGVDTTRAIVSCISLFWTVHHTAMLQTAATNSFRFGQDQQPSDC